MGPSLLFCGNYVALRLSSLILVLQRPSPLCTNCWLAGQVTTTIVSVSASGKPKPLTLHLRLFPHSLSESLSAFVSHEPEIIMTVAI